MSDQPNMRMEQIAQILSECWVDGVNPQPGTVRSFCQWCHHARPKHDSECPCVALQSALVRWQEAERLILDAERAIVYAATVLQPEGEENLPGQNALAGLKAQILALAPVVVIHHRGADGRFLPRTTTGT